MSGYGRLHGWVSGVVQGVGFRYYAQRKATHYGLTGWVRNLPDDRVEFLVEGPIGILKDYLKEMQIGPQSGQVDDVNFLWEEYEGEYKDFRIGL